MTSNLILIIALVTLLGGVAWAIFKAGGNRERKGQLEKDLDAVKKAKKIDDSVDSIDDNILLK